MLGGRYGGCWMLIEIMRVGLMALVSYGVVAIVWLVANDSWNDGIDRKINAKKNSDTYS